MKFTSSLVVLAITATAIAGPLHNKHGRMHNRNGQRHIAVRLVEANTTAPFATGTGTGLRNDTVLTTTPAELLPAATTSVARATTAEPSVSTVVAPTTPATTPALAPAPAPVPNSISECRIPTNTLIQGVTTQTQTRTITSTITLTIGEGPNSVVTTTTRVETITVIVEQTTIIVPGNSPATTTFSAGDRAQPTPDTVMPVTPDAEGNDDDANDDEDEGDEDEDESPDTENNASPTTAPYPIPTGPYTNSTTNGTIVAPPSTNSTINGTTIANGTYNELVARFPSPNRKVTKKTKQPEKKQMGKKQTTTKPKKAIRRTTQQTTSTPTAAAGVNGVSGVPPPNPTGAGTVSGCQKWYTAVSGDWCSKVANANGISVTDFIAWNPSVGTDCTSMVVGWSYCVAIKVDGATTGAPTTTPSSARTSSPTTTTAPAANVPTPSPVRENTVQGCTKWDLVVTGDYCALMAGRNNVALADFLSWNPSVGPQCNNLWLNYYACVGVSTSGGGGGGSGGGSTPTSSTTTASAGGGSTPTTRPNGYTIYHGSGSEADGWPAQSRWLDFESMWALNLPVIGTNCAWMTDPSGQPVAANTAQETADLKTAIMKTADAYSVPRSFVLAIVQQESNGCVRVHTTDNAVRNPGLMQTHNGAGTCNEKAQNLLLNSPRCTAGIIELMIVDGVKGTADGDGLVGVLAKTGYSAAQVERFYAAARIYNGGEAGGNWSRSDLSITAGTKCYASDVANRLTGWASGASGCELAG